MASRCKCILANNPEAEGILGALDTPGTKDSSLDSIHSNSIRLNNTDNYNTVLAAAGDCVREDLQKSVLVPDPDDQKVLAGTSDE